MSVNEFNEDFPELWQLTPKGVKLAVELLEGKMPSSLGLTFTSAYIILAGFEAIIRDNISGIDKEPGNRVETSEYYNKLLCKTKQVGRLYREASSLIKELEELQVVLMQTNHKLKGI